MADLVSDREVCNKPKVVEILLTGKFEIKCKVVEIWEVDQGGGNLLEAEIKGSMAEEGDKNTKCFHKTTNAHRRYSNINQIMRYRENWLKSQT